MREEAKQTVLLLFQAVQRNGDPERELHHFQLIHDKLLHHLSEEVPSDLKSRLLTIPWQLRALIDEACPHLTHHRLYQANPCGRTHPVRHSARGMGAAGQVGL
jgi:hypothetical protein